MTAAAWRAGGCPAARSKQHRRRRGRTLVEVFAGHETELVPALVGLSAADTVRAMAVWKAHATARRRRTGRTGPGRAPVPHPGRLRGPRRQPEPRGLRGVPHGSAHCTETPDGDGDPARTPAQRRHDALIDMARHFLDHQHTRRGGAPPPPQRDRRRRRPRRRPGWHDRRRHRAGRADDRPVGVRQRPAPGRHGRTVHHPGLRHRHPDHPGQPVERPRRPGPRLPVARMRPPRGLVRSPPRRPGPATGGPTNPANEALLCVRHHHKAHQPGWHLKLDTDGTLTVTDPDGRTRTTRPPGQLWPMVA